MTVRGTHEDPPQSLDSAWMLTGYLGPPVLRDCCRGCGDQGDWFWAIYLQIRSTAEILLIPRCTLVYLSGFFRAWSPSDERPQIGRRASISRSLHIWPLMSRENGITILPKPCVGWWRLSLPIKENCFPLKSGAMKTASGLSFNIMRNNYMGELD